MNERADIDRVLRRWFDDGPSTMPDRVVDVVAERIAVEHQRPARRLPWRLRDINPTLKIGAADRGRHRHRRRRSDPVAHRSCRDRWSARHREP